MSHGGCRQALPSGVAAERCSPTRHAPKMMATTVGMDRGHGKETAAVAPAPQGQVGPMSSAPGRLKASSCARGRGCGKGKAVLDFTGTRLLHPGFLHAAEVQELKCQQQPQGQGSQPQGNPARPGRSGLGFQLLELHPTHGAP